MLWNICLRSNRLENDDDTCRIGNVINERGMILLNAFISKKHLLKAIKIFKTISMRLGQFKMKLSLVFNNNNHQAFHLIWAKKPRLTKITKIGHLGNNPSWVHIVWIFIVPYPHEKPIYTPGTRGWSRLRNRMLAVVKNARKSVFFCKKKIT